MRKKNKWLNLLVLIVSIFVFSVCAFGVGETTIVSIENMVGAGSGNAAGTGGGPSARLKLEQCSINPGAYNVSLNPRVTMRFTKNVGDKIVRKNNSSAVKLVEKPSNKEVLSYKIGFSNDFLGRQFIQVLADNLKQEKTYAIIISKKIKARNGKETLDKDYEIIFTTGTKEDEKNNSNTNSKTVNTVDLNTPSNKAIKNNTNTTKFKNTNQLVDCKKSSYKGDGSKENPYCILVKEGIFTAPSKFWTKMVSSGDFNVIFEARENETAEGRLLYSFEFNKQNKVCSNWTNSWKNAFRFSPYCKYKVCDNGINLGLAWKGDLGFYWKNYKYKLNVCTLTENLSEEKRINVGDKIKISHYGDFDKKQTDRGTNYIIDLNKKSSSQNWEKEIIVDEDGLAVFTDKNFIKYGGNYRIEKVSEKSGENKTKNKATNMSFKNKIIDSKKLLFYKVEPCFINKIIDINLRKNLSFIFCNFIL